MKIAAYPLVAFLALAHAGIIVIPGTSTSMSGIKGIHSEYKDDISGDVLRLLVTGHTGKTHSLPMNTTIMPIRIFRNPKDLALEERADVYDLVTDCAGLLKNAAVSAAMQTWSHTAGACATGANALSTFLTENNYAQMKAIISGRIVSAKWLVPAGVAGYYLNVKLASLSLGSSDACGEKQPTTYAGDASSAMYQFCLSLQAAKMASVTTRYDASDAATLDAKSGAGEQGLTKFFVDTKEFSVADTCSDYGIVWKRDLELAWKHRAARHLMAEAL